MAYADFVTAMMAFFLVMWIVGLNQSIKDAVQAYFRDPVGFMKAVDGGKKPISTGSAGDQPIEKVINNLKKMNSESQAAQSQEVKRFEQVKSSVEHYMAQHPEFRDLKKSVRISISNDGLRIDLLETTGDVFFDSGSASMKPRTKTLLKGISAEMGRLPNLVVIEGHTDSRPYSGPNGWTNWELSTARANAARAIVEQSGIRANQITEVRGLADRMLLDPKHPDSYKNRRVSILLPFSGSAKNKVVSPGDFAEKMKREF